MQQIPSWETNRFSATQEFPRLLWNPKVHYRIHKSPQPIPNLIRIDPVHIPTSHLLQINLNIVFPSTPWSSNSFFHSVFSTRTLYTSLVSPTRATFPALFILLDLISPKIFGEQYSSLRSSLCSFLYSPVTSSLLSPNIFKDHLEDLGVDGRIMLKWIIKKLGGGTD